MALILHIDEDSRSGSRVRKLLTSAGHRVEYADSGLDGVRLAKTCGPDLVLVDVALHDLDGYQVVVRLRSIARLRGVPIIVTGASKDRGPSLAVGADGFIAKPFDGRRFAKVIERCMGGHREGRTSSSDQLRQQSRQVVEQLERKVIELSDAKERLEEVARLRTEFLQNVSHELATPMTPVVGYLHLLLNLELGPLTPLQRKCLESIERSTQRLRSVVDTLLDVSSLETGRMHFYVREYDFVAVFEQALASARPRFEAAHIEIMEGPLPARRTLHGDSDKLRRAMVHILDNAVKFTPAQGQVACEVRLGRSRRGGAEWFEFVVADSGPGIEPSKIASVFEPFFQVDGSPRRRHGGVGLGLAFAKRVSESLGGGIDLQSPPGETVAGHKLGGTLVKLHVPVDLPGMPRPRAGE